ncbi:hypothetical protein [Actinoallomurus sp. CA-150999]|uniref:hypothetical protein n=1 Tax=Actinoallomurus sp. CA-150999 TaxID=3239887 RepID=UPI003D8DE593
MNGDEVLICTHYLGDNVEQAKAALGLAPGTVKSRVHNAVRAVRALPGSCAVRD